MMRFFVLLTIVTVAAAAGGFEPGLRVRFDQDENPSAGESYFYDVPRSLEAARDEGWKRARRPRGPLPQLVMYCPSDKVLCALFDDTGYIAGLQVAVSKLEFSNNVFDWRKRGFTSWNTTVDSACKTFWTLQQYFVDEEFLSRSPEDRLASRDSTRTLQAGAIWTTGTDRQLLKISTQEDDITSEQVFTEQACITWMGLHHYYNMSTTTECSAEQMYPWFLLTSNSELIATGFFTFGNLELSDTKDWFERPSQAVVQAIVPSGPECIYELASDPGALTMHIYYIDEPWTITC